MQAPYLIGARRQQISISILCHRFLHGNLGKISRFIHKYRGIFIIKYNKAIGKLLAPIFAYHIRLVKIRILNLPRLKSRGSQPRILTDSDTLGYPRSSYGSYICYAPITRSPSFKIFIAAFTSLSCTAPHCGQVHSRTDKSLVPEFICPQQLQVWLDGKNLSILITFLPYHSAL